MKPTNSRTLAKYILLQIPDLALLVIILVLLRKWFGISRMLTGILIVFWILKDILLYPLLRRAYEGRPSKSHPMIGEKGIARDRLDPEGYAWVRGELWRARVAQGSAPVEPGRPLIVQDARGLTLEVIADPPARADRSPGTTRSGFKR